MDKDKVASDTPVGSGVEHLTVMVYYWKCHGLQRSQKLADSTEDKHKLYIVLFFKERKAESGQAMKLRVSRFWSKVKGVCCGCVGSGSQQHTASVGTALRGDSRHACTFSESCSLSYKSTSVQWLGLTSMTLYNPCQPPNTIRLSSCPLNTSVGIRLQQELLRGQKLQIIKHPCI